MAGFVTAFPTSLKVELPGGVHNFNSGGDAFSLALGVGTPAGDYGAATTNLSDLGSDEVSTSGTGYSQWDWTNGQNISPSHGSVSSSFWSWSVNPTWAGPCTFSTSGCIIFNKTKSNKCAYVGSFGGILTVSGSAFTLLLPVNAAETAILGLI